MRVEVTLNRPYPEVVSGLWNAEAYYVRRENTPVDPKQPDYWVNWSDRGDMPTGQEPLTEGQASFYGKLIVPRVVEEGPKLTRLDYSSYERVDFDVLAGIENGGLCRNGDSLIPVPRSSVARQANQFNTYLRDVDPIGMMRRMRGNVAGLNIEMVNQDVVRYRNYANWLLSIEGESEGLISISAAARYETLGQ